MLAWLPRRCGKLQEFIACLKIYRLIDSFFLINACLLVIGSREYNNLVKFIPKQIKKVNHYEPNNKS
jgi:hypothetical protein